LVGYLDRVASPKGAPLALDVLITDCAGKVSSGLLSYTEAVEFIDRCVAIAGRDWPIAPPVAGRGTGNNQVRDVIQALIAEACATARGDTSLVVRVMLAGTTAQCFAVVNELGLAEMALARGNDLLRQIPPDDSARTTTELGLRSIEAEFYARTGQLANAERAERQTAEPGFMSGNTILHRLVREQLASNRVLTAYQAGRYAEALREYPERLTVVESLSRDAAAAEREEDRRWIVSTRELLSGDLANWSAVLFDLAKRLEERERIGRPLGVPHGVQDDVDDRARDEAIAWLQRETPELLTAARLRAQVGALLERALPLAVEIEAWEFAGVQAHRLALLRLGEGRADDADALMARVLEYSGRVGDHVRTRDAHIYFGDRALSRQDGPGALNLFQRAAREQMRLLVGLGRHAREDVWTEFLAGKVLEVVRAGGDPLAAVMVAESLKAVRLTVALSRGLTGVPSGDAVSQQLGELRARGEKLRLRALFAPAERERVAAELAAVESALEEEGHAIHVRDPRYSRWCDAIGLDLSDGAALVRRLRRFGPRTTFLGTIFTPDVVWVYAVWDGQTVVERRPYPSSSGAPRSHTDPAFLASVAETLLPPIADRLRRLEPSDRLIVAPSRGMYTVPVAALPFDGRPLCRLVTPTYIQGAGVLEALPLRPADRPRSMLCAAAPLRPDLPPLPGALLESELITELFRGNKGSVTQLTGPDATVANVRAAGAHDVFHFACHAGDGVLPRDVPSLLLTPDPSGNDSGELSHSRVLSELAVPDGCLINLAACATAHQQERTAQVGDGLVPAFLLAGAGGVLCSGWPIKDGATSLFQSHFYQRLIYGRTAAEALVETQRDCLDGILGPEMADPINWAGYLLFGDG
jgi:hypothetical protein